MGLKSNHQRFDIVMIFFFIQGYTLHSTATFNPFLCCDTDPIIIQFVERNLRVLRVERRLLRAKNAPLGNLFLYKAFKTESTKLCKAVSVALKMRSACCRAERISFHQLFS